VYWAIGCQHSKKINPNIVRQSVEQENVRESKKILLQQKIQIKQVDVREMQPGQTLEADFNL